MVNALKPVDFARLGDLIDMYRPIEEINPAVITLGFNQHFDEDRLRQDLGDRGLYPKVVRIGSYAGERFCSSRIIVSQVLERYSGKGTGENTFLDKSNIF